MIKKITDRFTDPDGNFIIFVGSIHLFNHEPPHDAKLFSEKKQGVEIIPGIIESLDTSLKSKNYLCAINYFDLRNRNELYLKNILSLNNLEEKEMRTRELMLRKKRDSSEHYGGAFGYQHK